MPWSSSPLQSQAAPAAQELVKDVPNALELSPMKREWIESEGEENHQWLLAEFCELLARQAPESVLDVGCGSGNLMRAMRGRGLSVRGLDQASERLDALGAEGFEVHAGSAYELPFYDRSVDWLAMRHVPHHLEDPARAFREALRVADRGLLIAEPHFDASLPCQRGAQALDVWEKRQHRRRGMHHDEVYDLGALLQLLPPEVETQYELHVTRHFRPRARALAPFAEASASLLDDVPTGDAEHQAREDLLAQLKESGLSWNGSLCLSLRRR